uniref:Uracil phosphoribosyltransferase n=1 Tax=uncultured bacterium fosmid pJB84G2 TaxID=1478072 RepID=A0A0H3UAQ4_9BACT|nr:hypothetical protein [uncultured bacterium fosmid pJB84G2]
MIKLIKHPLIETKLSIMRDKDTPDAAFRTCLNEIASLMTFEVFKDLAVKEGEEFETPTGAKLNRIKLQNHIILAPVLRAGIGMVDGVRAMMPNARVGHIGLYRNEETLKPVEYYFKLPKEKDSLVVILDPMLATGGSASAAIEAVRAHGYSNIRLMCLIGCPEGKKVLEEKYPEIDVYLASIDERLNEKGYILPGLGDAGDRIFGTK